jgi:asparagine synthase (glutamine-hydrolysing)
VAAHLRERAFPHHELTFFDAIRKLPPAYTLTLRDTGCRLERYWHPDRLPYIRLSSETAYVEAFVDIYTKAVETRLRSIHPVGTHVSGGLDSSSIAVLAARSLKRQGKSLQGFCWEPSPHGDVEAPDERALIQAVCAQEHVPIHYLSLTEADCMTILQRDVTREPTLDTLMYEEQVQRQAASHQIRVLLSGWGGDEFLTYDGQGYHAQLILQGRWRTFYRELQAMGYNPRKLLLTEVVMSLAPIWGQNMVVYFKPHWAPRSPFQSYIDPVFAQRIRRQAKTLAHGPLRAVGVRRTQLWLLNLGHLTQRIEDWAANAARYRIVYRYPLLDRRVVEFALGLPPESFFHNGKSRWFARRALEKLLPAAVVWNNDKTDPVRSKQLAEVSPKVLAALGHQLAARATLPARAAYLDTPCLLERLTSGAPIKFVEVPSLWRAVQFLGESVRQ